MHLTSVFPRSLLLWVLVTLNKSDHLTEDIWLDLTQISDWHTSSCTTSRVSGRQVTQLKTDVRLGKSQTSSQITQDSGPPDRLGVRCTIWGNIAKYLTGLSSSWVPQDQRTGHRITLLVDIIIIMTDCIVTQEYLMTHSSEAGHSLVINQVDTVICLRDKTLKPQSVLFNWHTWSIHTRMEHRLMDEVDTGQFYTAVKSLDTLLK